MSNQLPVSEATQRIADRLSAVRRHGFVGREAELELFRTALLADEPPFVVLHIYGPGGVGKTTLLQEYGRIAAEHGRFVIHLDGRHLAPNPPAFATAVQQATGAPTGATAFTHWPPNSVLLIDTYETLTPLDTWLRATFLPQMPADALIIIAGRQTPLAWYSDGGWAELTRIISLGNLRPEDCQAYLTARGVPREQHAATLDFTHGHPLALALMANLYQQNAAPTPTQSNGERNVVHILLQRFLQDVPSSSQRQALELCVVTWATTEALLAELFGTEAAFELFQWLRQLSFIEQGPYGLFPHDLARDVLDADLHWRNPTGYAQLQQVALNYLRQQFQQAGPVERQRIRLDILFVNRHAPGIAPFFAWDALDSAYAEPANPADLPAILEMVQAHEGRQSAEIARHWWQRQPEAFLVYRTTAGELYGFMTQLALDRATAEDAAIDPAVTVAWQYAQTHQPTQPDEVMLHLRFWMARESYQAISPAINLTAVNCTIHWITTPKLVWSFVTMSNPDFMAPHFASIRFGRTPEADFVVGERTYGVFSHNWITDPVSTWHKDIKGVEAAAPQAEMIAPKRQIVLSQTEFADAARQALRDYTRPDLLAANPLLHSGLLPETEQTPTVLQAVLRQAIIDLKHNPKDAKLYRALWHTYIEPEPTQEKTAERLDLPFNTYRHHLTTGLERLIAGLWRRQLSASS
jgi:hypothetical protein